MENGGGAPSRLGPPEIQSGLSRHPLPPSFSIVCVDFLDAFLPSTLHLRNVWVLNENNAAIIHLHLVHDAAYQDVNDLRLLALSDLQWPIFHIWHDSLNRQTTAGLNSLQSEFHSWTWDERRNRRTFFFSFNTFDELGTNPRLTFCLLSYNFQFQTFYIK